MPQAVMVSMSRSRRAATGPDPAVRPHIRVGDGTAAAAEQPAVPAAACQVELVVDAAVEAAGRGVDPAQLRDGTRP